MSDEARDSLESALQSVDPARRSFLRQLLTAAGAAAVLAAPATRTLADEPAVLAQKKGKGKKGKGKKKAAH